MATSSEDRVFQDTRLAELLTRLFDADELRRWVHETLGEEVHRELPGVLVTLDELAVRSVQAAQRRGLVDESFFDRLRAVRPALTSRINHVARLWLGEPNLPQPVQAAEMPQGARTAEPRYLSERDRTLGAPLAAAYVRKQELEATGVDTAEVVSEILRIKRELRSGGQLRPGDRLGDNSYLLLERIGRGSSANVWKALDQVSGRPVAIKVLHSELAGDVIRRERFFYSARRMAALDHPAVVRIIEPHGEDDGHYYFVMELAEGGDLQQAVFAGRVNASELVPMLLRLGEALAVAHAHGLVHGDVKPANVLLTEGGDPRLADFNLAMAADTYPSGTRSGVFGTLVYAAPEMLDRPQNADASADVYGLGMTAAFVLHGDTPSRMVLRDAAGFVAGLACDEPLKRILQRAVAWAASDRFADAASFCQALREYVRRPQRIDASRRSSTQDPAAPEPVADDRIRAPFVRDDEPVQAAEPSSARELPAETREHIQLILEGEVTQIDSEALQRIVEEARATTGDAALSIVSIRSGSILLELDVSAEAAAMLKRLFESGDLKSIGGIPILAIRHDHARLPGAASGVTPESAEAVLADFFMRAFAAEDIRRFVRSFSDGARLDAALPGMSASLSHLASEAVRVLVRHNLVCPELFAKLEAERPRHCDEIRQISRLFDETTGAALRRDAP